MDVLLTVLKPVEQKVRLLLVVELVREIATDVQDHAMVLAPDVMDV